MKYSAPNGRLESDFFAGGYRAEMTRNIHNIVQSEAAEPCRSTAVHQQHLVNIFEGSLK